MPALRAALAILLTMLFAGLLAACQTAAPAPAAAPGTTQQKTPAAPAAATPAAQTTPGTQAAAKPREAAGKVTFGVFGTCTGCYNAGDVISGVNAFWYWPAMDGLTWVDRTGKLNPALAREWSTTDARTWTFRIRDDVRWHDGTPVEAADLAATMNWIRNPQNQARGVTSFPDVTNVTAPDRSTLVIELNKQVPSFPKQISLTLLTNGRQLEARGREYWANPQGSGPYRFVSWSNQTNSIEYQAMPSSFTSARGTPNVRDVVLRFIPEPATLVAALRTGEVDIATSVPSDLVNELRASNFDIKENKGTASYHYDLNMYTGPTRDVRVRQAMNLAVNRESILRNLFGGYGELDGQLIGSAVLGYSADVRPYAFDQARARQLMQDAGLPNGFSIRMSVLGAASGPGGSNVASAIAADLARINVNVELVPLDTAVWLAAFSGRQDQRLDMSYATINWERSFEADSVWRFWSSDRTPETGRRWTDENFDRLYQQAKTTLNEQERGRLFQQAGRYLHDNAAALFLWNLSQAVALNKRVDWEPGLFADAYTTRLSLR